MKKEHIQMLRNRVKHCVCKYCGGQLKLRQISFSEFEDARTEIFCSDCDRIEFGVEKRSTTARNSLWRTADLIAIQILTTAKTQSR